MEASDLPVVVIGGGPVGLAAAAHLLERGETPLVLEAGDEVGASVRQWAHVRLFSPWRFNLDAACRRLLEQSGWSPPPPHELPTGGELIERYLRPLSELPAVSTDLLLHHQVVAVTRLGMDKVHSTGRDLVPFVVRAHNGEGQREFLARAVIDASGTWSTPNPLGAAGLPAVGEPGASDRIGRALPDVLGADRSRFAGRRVLVVGAGHSAATTLLALVELQREVPATEIVWLLRSPGAPRAFGGGDLDALPARGKLGTDLRSQVTAGRVELVTNFPISGVSMTDERVQLIGWTGEWEQRLKADIIVRATGFRPDLSILGELRLDLDPALECAAALGPLIDPNVHSCGTVRPHGAKELAHHEVGLYVVGVKSYGRAPTFLLATGYEQVRSIAAALTGDNVAAEQVQLQLPETGVCTSTLNLIGDEQLSGCGSNCGGPQEPSDTGVSSSSGLPESTPGRFSSIQPTSVPKG